jgi:thioredoxin 1
MKIVKYGAAWCNPCKQLDKVIDSLSGQLVIEKVDIDTDSGQEAATNFGIRSVPVVIKFDENGKELSRKSGALTEKQLLDFVNN